MFARIQRFLEHPLSRVLFSVAIVVSLIPHKWMLESDAWFLALFGPEVIARGVLAFRRESLPVLPGRRRQKGWRAPTVTEFVLLLLDLIAVISFMPVVAGTFLNARWLRLFRLSRTVLLLRYWAPVVTDLWEVTRRPERRRQLIFVFGSMIVICFAGAVLLDHVTTEIGDDFDGDGVVGDEHDHDFFVRMWWAFRQLEDPGNLLASPHDAGTLVVSVGLTLAGLFVISFIIGIGTDVVSDLSEIARSRSPGLSRHTVIVNANRSAQRLLRELVHEEFKLLPAATQVVGFRWLAQLWRNARTSRAFVVVGRNAERPEFLSEQEFSRVVYRAWEDDDDDTLIARADLLTARRIVVLADDEDRQPDDDTVRMTVSIVEQMLECEDEQPRRLVTEILSLDNLPAAGRAMQRSQPPLQTTVVPTEVLIARSVGAVCRRRGLGALLTELLRSQGHEIYAWEPEREGAGPVLSACGGSHPLEALARAGSGLGRRRVIPLGVIPGDVDGDLRLNPAGELAATPRGVIAIAQDAGSLTELVAGHAGAAPASPQAHIEVSVQSEAGLQLRRMLVCGYRPATVQLLESLAAHASEDAEILLLVADPRAKALAIEGFRAQGALVRQGLASGADGTFDVDAQDVSRVRWQPAAGAAHATRAVAVRIAVADWASPRALGELPFDMGSASNFDMVLFSTNGGRESDARNTTGLMAVEALVAAQAPARPPRVVAEVDDVELAARLNTRFRSMGRDEVHVFSTDELRALIVFQSLVVPRYSTLLVDLVAERGGLGTQRLLAVQAHVAQGTPTEIGYAKLAETLRAQGKILVAVDARDGAGPRVGEVEHVDLATSRLWILAEPEPQA